MIEISDMKKLIDSIKKIRIAVGEKKLGYVLEEEKKIARKLRKHIKIS